MTRGDPLVLYISTLFHTLLFSLQIIIKLYSTKTNKKRSEYIIKGLTSAEELHFKKQVWQNLFFKHKTLETKTKRHMKKGGNVSCSNFKKSLRRFEKRRTKRSSYKIKTMIQETRSLTPAVFTLKTFVLMQFDESSWRSSIKSLKYKNWLKSFSIRESFHCKKLFVYQLIFNWYLTHANQI